MQQLCALLLRCQTCLITVEQKHDYYEQIAVAEQMESEPVDMTQKLSLH